MKYKLVRSRSAVPVAKLRGGLKLAISDMCEVASSSTQMTIIWADIEARSGR